MMHALWHWLLHLLAWCATDPAMIDAERARCAGAVAVAYAAMAPEPTPPAPPRREPSPPDPQPAPAPPPPQRQPCPQCGDTGRIYRSDGGWVRCNHACPTGRCPTKSLP